MLNTLLQCAQLNPLSSLEVCVSLVSYPFCFFCQFLSYKGSLFLLGKDKSVVLWSIQDHITTAGSTDSKSSGSIIKQTGEGGDKSESPSLGPRGVYYGHDDTVEDVAFSPTR